MTRKKLLIFGAGPTSSLIVHNLKSSKFKDEFDIHVWEKSRGIGGRFSTSRSPDNSNASASCYGDLGAQYLTWSGKPFSKPYFNKLLEHKLIKELETRNIPGFHHDAEKTHYVCTIGMSSVVKHFFNQESGRDISLKCNKRVTSITNPMLTDSSPSIVVGTEEGGQENFDIVVSTIPVPQILELDNVDLILKETLNLKSELEKVQYSTRFALGLFYDSIEGPFPTGFKPQPINFLNDPIIRYWSVENKKRGTENREQCAIVVHTSVSFGAENVDKPPDAMKALLMEKVYEKLDHIGRKTPVYVKCHRWKYSQVDTPFAGAPGCVKLANNIIAAGDGFARSGFEGCIESSQKTVKLLLESLIQ